MRRIMLVCPVSGLLLVLAGCGGSGAYNQHASFCKEELATLESLTAAFKTVKDKESAKTALPTINAALDRYEKLPARAATLPKLNASENSNLEREYRANMVSVSLGLDSAARQALLDSRDNPDLREAVKRMNGITKDISKKLWDATH